MRGVNVLSSENVAFAIKEICKDHGIVTCGDYVLRNRNGELDFALLVNDDDAVSSKQLPLQLVLDKKGINDINFNIFFSTNLQSDFLERFLERFFGAHSQQRQSLLNSESSSGTLMEDSISPAQSSISSISSRSKKLAKYTILSKDTSKVRRLKKE